MTAPVISVTPDTRIKKAIQLMLEHNISGLPVVDDNAVLCGILTEGDLLARCAHEGRKLPGDSPSCFEEYIRWHGAVVSDCMTRTVVSVSPDEKLAALVSLIQTKNIKRIPVVLNGKLVGLVSRHDILRAIASDRDVVADGDDALRLAVQTRLYEELDLKPEETPVRVSGSVVELIDPGTDPARRRAMELVAESVAGVAGVRFRSDGTRPTPSP